MGIERLALVEKGNEVLAVIGIGLQPDERSLAEDEQFLSSVSNQLGHLILTHKLSEELLLAREWDSFNRFASFILHDLKNLATLQGMTLENAKQFSQNPEFISDAFATFDQTTEKMINLIASLSVQRGQFSLKQQPVNILEVISNTFDHLKIEQWNGIQVRTAFPPTGATPSYLRRSRVTPKGLHKLASECDSEFAERRRFGGGHRIQRDARQDYRVDPRYGMRHFSRKTRKLVPPLSDN